MRTKQETIDYCNAEIREVRNNFPIQKRLGEKQAVLDAIERTYLDVIRFLEDETTETTLVG